MRAPFQILAIPYRLKPNLQYCVLHRSDIDQYQFVAGGGEDDEQPIEAAAREIYEETSVKAGHIVPLTSMAYIPANVISKIVLSSEHNGFEWLTYDEAITRLTWDSNKTALYELNCRLLEACQIGGLEGKTC